MATESLAIVILISGRGSNMKAIIDAASSQSIPVDVRAIISNDPTAAGLKTARQTGLTTRALDHSKFENRDSFDAALIELIDEYQPELVVLAGFMRILGETFVSHYAGRLMNIHPALLPAFPGFNTHERVLDAGVTRHGATVHFVTHDVDAGPIIVQAAVEVRNGDSESELAARVLEQEHRIYPLAVGWFAEGRLNIVKGNVLLDGARRPEQGLISD
ncbi:MAG: phosphoribosylglycinamide formyltransferase [Acidiferrobacterales bacterium]